MPHQVSVERLVVAEQLLLEVAGGVWGHVSFKPIERACRRSRVQKVRLQVPHGAGDAGKLRAAEAKVRCAEHGHHAKAPP